MAFTRLNMSKEGGSSDRGWHMVIAPGSAEKSFAQQNVLEEEFYKSLPRAHFLRPGCFHAAAKQGAFSPDKTDLCFKGKWLQDQSPWDSKSPTTESYSRSPHPLAQPGFYNFKIPQSRYCETTTEYHAHTLPLPNTKLAVFKQSEHCRPQGIKTSVVERPPLMRAAVSPTLANLTSINPNQEETYDHKFQPSQDQEIHTQCFSSLRQCTLNSTSTKICEMQRHLWNHVDQAQSTKTQNVFSVTNWAQDPHVSNNSLTRPQSPSSPGHLNIQRDSKLTGYCKLSVYNGACYTSHTPRDDSDLSSQSHGRSTQKNSKQKTKKESNKAENYLSGNRNNRQVDTKSKNVFGQPCVIATLRSDCTTRPVNKTTVIEDLKKLILMDEVTGSLTPSRCATECPQSSSSLKTLKCCNPVLSRNSVPSPNHHFLQSDPQMCQSEGGFPDTLVCDNQNPRNLKSKACRQNWESLVNAADAYETQETADLLARESSDMQSGTGPESHSQHLSKASDDNVFIDFPDQLSHLEAMLMRLSTDLLKEKKNKVALLAEVLKLRMSNQHLKEESLLAYTQLHKICQMFGIKPEPVD